MYKIEEGVYLAPTPAGAYYAAASPLADAGRTFVMSLMRSDSSPQLNEASIHSWEKSHTNVTDLLYRLQQTGYIQALKTPHTPPSGALEDILPPMIANFSSTKKVLLADTQGFYIASTGFAHETAEEISALSADLAALHGRHYGLIEKNLGLAYSSWGLVDASGNSQLGLWPLHIGEYRFVLALAGMPQLNQMQFTDLVWLLQRRYGK